MIHAIVGNEVIARHDVSLGDRVILKQNQVYKIDRVMPSDKVQSGILIGLEGHDLMFDANISYVEDRLPLSYDDILKFNT